MDSGSVSAKTTKRTITEVSGAKKTAMMKHRTVTESDFDHLRQHLLDVTPSACKKQPQIRFPVAKKVCRVMRRRGRKLHEKMHVNQYQSCCRILDQIYTMVVTLNHLGFYQRQISAWLCDFCQNRYTYFKDLFHHDSAKVLYFETNKFQFQKDKAVLKQRILYHIDKGNKKEFTKAEELEELRVYFENIVIEKEALKLKELEEQICRKLYFSFANNYEVLVNRMERECQKQSKELMEHQTIQEYIKKCSKINFLRHNHLDKVENRLQQKYKEQRDAYAFAH